MKLKPIYKLFLKLGGASYRRVGLLKGEPQGVLSSTTGKKNNQLIARRHCRRRGFAPQLFKYNYSI